ncbi:putative DNA-dependent metalloprotease WSS1 like protein [Fusarium oxysporum f. sp. albedinis]|nr:putative DNA-dependent metalloprotease WSS1 like protein [Fusarium oxysporum f. sp. albedinis]
MALHNDDWHQVIRIQSDTRLTTSDSKDSFKNLDSNTTEEEFTPGEFDTQNVPMSNIVKNYINCHHSNWPIAPSVDEFDEERHRHVRQRETGLAVFWLADVERTHIRFFTLKNREGGLCTISPLSNFQKNTDRYVFYSEFVVHPHTNAKTQASLIKQAIRQAARAAKARLDLDQPQPPLRDLVRYREVGDGQDVLSAFSGSIYIVVISEGVVSTKDPVHTFLGITL